MTDPCAMWAPPDVPACGGPAAAAAQDIDSLSGKVLRAYEELHLRYALTGQLTVAEVADLILEHVLNALPAARAELRLAAAQAPIQIRRAPVAGAADAAAGTALLGRIRPVADAVSAMVLDRPYGQGLPWGRVAEVLRAGAATRR